MRPFLPVSALIIGIIIAAPAMAQIFGTSSSSAYSTDTSSQYSSYTQSSPGYSSAFSSYRTTSSVNNTTGTNGAASSLNNATGTYGTTSSLTTTSGVSGTINGSYRYGSTASTGVLAASGSNVGTTPAGLPNTGGGGMAH